MALLRAIGDFITDMGKLSRRKPAGKINRADVAKFGARIKDLGKGDLLPADARLNSNTIILHKYVDLLDQIISEQLGLSNACDIMAGTSQPAKGSLRLSITNVAAPVNMDFGIGKAAIAAPCRVRQCAISNIGFNCGAQFGDCISEQGFKLGDNRPTCCAFLFCHALSDRMLSRLEQGAGLTPVVRDQIDRASRTRRLNDRIKGCAIAVARCVDHFFAALAAV